MNAFPIFARELRIAARSSSLFWGRFSVGLLAATVGTFQFISPPPGTAVAAVGQVAFHGLAGGAFILAAGACLLASNVLSGEWRSGTLELLRLTRVRPWDVVLGKLASAGVNCSFCLGAFLPILMLPVLTGGVSGLAAFCMGLSLANVLFVALAAGLLASAGQANGFQAARNALAVAGCALTLPLLASLFEVTPVVLLSAATPALLSADRTLRGSLNVFWCSLLASHAVGWLLLALAAYRLKRTMDAPVTVLPVSRSHRSPANEPDLPLVHRRRWVSALDREQPIEWLVYWRQQVKGTVWFIALMALSAGGWVQIVRYANALTGNPIASGVGLPQELGFSIAGAAIVAWMAGRLFVEGRRNGELELVLSTPAGAESLVLEQTTLLGRLFPWPVLLMQVPLLPWALSEPLKASFLVAGEVQNGWALFYPVTLLLQVLNTYLSVQALCYVGVWLSGWGPTRLRSVLWTVLLVKGPAVLLLLMGWGLFGLTRGEILPRYWLTWCIPQILVTAFHLFLLQRTGSVLFKARKAGRYGRLAENGGRSESSNDHSRCGTQERGG